MAPRETENNAYANFWGEEQRALCYVMVFSGVVNCHFLSSRGLEMRGPSQIKPSGSGDENDHFQPILLTRSPMLLN